MLDSNLLSENEKTSLVESFKDFAESFLHPMSGYSIEEILEETDFYPEESDCEGDVFGFRCQDCGKLITMKKTTYSKYFMPWCIGNGQDGFIEDCFDMFCNEPGEEIEFVYCIANESETFIKIGFSTDPMKRLKSLQTASPHKLEIVSFFIGDISAEKSAQNKFRQFSTEANNEWFSYNKEIVDYFHDKCPIELF